MSPSAVQALTSLTSSETIPCLRGGEVSAEVNEVNIASQEERAQHDQGPPCTIELRSSCPTFDESLHLHHLVCVVPLDDGAGCFTRCFHDPVAKATGQPVDELWDSSRDPWRTDHGEGTRP